MHQWDIHEIDLIADERHDWWTFPLSAVPRKYYIGSGLESKVDRSAGRRRVLHSGRGDPGRCMDAPGTPWP